MLLWLPKWHVDQEPVDDQRGLVVPRVQVVARSSRISSLVGVRARDEDEGQKDQHHSRILYTTHQE